MPRVSVIVPFFDAASYLECCIKSALTQTITDWEMLLVNDGSTDQSMRIAQRFANADSRISVLQHANGENRGVSCSRQLGLDHAAGEFIAFLDADDMFLPSKLERQLQDTDDHPRCGVFHTAVETIDENAAPFSGTTRFNEFSLKSKEYAFDEQPKFLQSHAVCNSSTLIRRPLLDEISIGYSQLFQAEDFVLWVRLSEVTCFYFNAHPMVRYREHAKSATQRMSSIPAAQELRNVEFLSAVIATAQRDTTVHRAQQLLEQQLSETVRRVRSETGLSDPTQAITPGSNDPIFHSRIHGLLRRVRRAIQVLRFGS